MVREDINNHVLTEVSEDHKNNDTSIFHDEFFIYRPDKKRPMSKNEDTSFFLNYSKNNSHIKSGLLTMQSREEDILNIVSNLNKPLNERIIDKIQKSTTKHSVKSTYNFSTTDKSKDNSNSNYANNLGNLIKKSTNDNIVTNVNNNNNNNNNNYNNYNNYNSNNIIEPKQIVKVSVVQKQLLKKEGKKVDTFQLYNSNNNNSNQNTEGKKKVDLFNVSNVPSSSKNNFNTKNDKSDRNERIDKSPMPVTVKNGKPTLLDANSMKVNIAVTSNNNNNNNKIFEYKQAKNDIVPNSSRFANLLYASESNNKNYSSTQRDHSNSNANTNTNSNSNNQVNKKTHHKNVKSFDFNKISQAIETPTYQRLINQNQDIKYSEMISTTNNKNTEERQDPISSLNYNKNSKQRISSIHNYDSLLSKGRQEKSLSKIHNVQVSNKDIDVNNYLSNVNKLTKLNSDQNIVSHTAKLNNYLTNSSKKVIENANNTPSTHRMISSISVKAGASKSQVKINFSNNERMPSSNRAGSGVGSGVGSSNGNGKVIKNYYQAEPKISMTTKSHHSKSKSKDMTNLITDKSIKNTPSNRRMNSGDIFSNNYLNSNSNNHNNNGINYINNNSNNMNVLIQKITSTRNVVDKKNNHFSPPKKNLRIL